MSFIHCCSNLASKSLIQKKLRLNWFSWRIGKHYYCSWLKPEKQLFSIHHYHNKASCILSVNFNNHNHMSSYRQLSTSQSLSGDKYRESMNELKIEIQSMDVSKLSEFVAK